MNFAASAHLLFPPSESKTIPLEGCTCQCPFFGKTKVQAMAIRLKKKQRLSEVAETTRAQSEKPSPDKSSVMSWWRRDWFFCLILAVVTLLAYQPAWHGGLLWDDHFNMTTPELRSPDGLWRIWFVPRTTQQYYPLLYTSYWLQDRCWADSTTGYHFVN